MGEDAIHKKQLLDWKRLLKIRWKRLLKIRWKKLQTAVQRRRRAEKALLVAQRRVRAAEAAYCVELDRNSDILAEILGSEIVIAFWRCVFLPDLAKLQLLYRLAQGESVVAPLDARGFLMLEVRWDGDHLKYRAFRTTEGKKSLFSWQAMRDLQEGVERFLGREVPFEEEW